MPVVSVNSEQKPMIDNTAKVSSFESVIIPIVTQPSLQGVNIVSTTAQNPGIATVLSTDNLHPVTVYQQGTSTVSEQPVSITFQQGTNTVSEQPVPITLQQGTSTVSIVRAAQVDPKSSQDGSTIVILPQEEVCIFTYKSYFGVIIFSCLSLGVCFSVFHSVAGKREKTVLDFGSNQDLHYNR